MTEFFVDLHPVYQRDFDFAGAAKAGITGAYIKVSEGESIRYDNFWPLVKRAEDNGMGVLAYAWIHKGDTAYVGRQVANLQRALGDRNLGFVLDWEKPKEGSGLGNPGIREVRDFFGIAKKRDLVGKALYTGRWYWAGHVGSPSLLVPELEGIALINSDYGARNAALPPQQAYEANIGPDAWAPMGGKAVTFVQFGSNVQVGGIAGGVDCNAYRGTEAALERFFDMAPEATRVTRARRRIDRAEQDLEVATALLDEAVEHRPDVLKGWYETKAARDRARGALRDLPKR